MYQIFIPWKQEDGPTYGHTESAGLLASPCIGGGNTKVHARSKEKLNIQYGIWVYKYYWTVVKGGESLVFTDKHTSQTLKK